VVTGVQPTVAIVGLGKMGLVHGAAVTIAGGRIVGLVDPQPRTLGNARWIGLNAPYYPSLDKLLQVTAPDAALICVPSNINLQLARQCQAAGVRGIFLEKPLAHTAEIADELVRLAENTAIVDGLGFMLRHVPSFRFALQLIRDGGIGEIREVRADALMDARLSADGGWFRQQAISGGGALTSLGSHLLSLLDAAFGAIVKVESARLVAAAGEVEDRAQATVCYNGTVRATLTVAWDAPGYEAMHVGLVFEGSLGRLVVDAEHVERVHGTRQKIWTERQLPDDAPGFVGGRGYARQDAHFLAAVIGRHGDRVAWREGARVQHALSSLYKVSAAAA
jgi:predicted dehydrogenase